jgi:hypothetical protein
MNTFVDTDYSEYSHYTPALFDSQGPQQQIALMDDHGERSSRHSATAGKGDSPLTAFLRSKKQVTLSGTQHTDSTVDTFAQEQEWENNDDAVPDDESIVSIDIYDLIEDDLIPLSSFEDDLIPLSSYNEDAVDEALKWTEALIDRHDDDDDDEESIEEAPLHEPTSSLNEAFVKLTKCMERSDLTRQLIKQHSDRSLGSSATSTIDNSQHSFNHHDSLRLHDPLGPSSCHSSTSSGLVRPPRIQKADGITRSGLIRRHSHRSRSGPDITRRGLVNKNSLVSLNGSMNSISLHRNSSWGNLSRSSSFRKPKLSQEQTSHILMERSASSSNLRVKTRLSQNMNRRQMLDQYFVVAGPKLKPKATSNDLLQRF